MSGGGVNGNTASSSYSSSYGGGVYVADRGSLSISGGTIIGNTASATTTGSYANGGGVCVAGGGSFSMSGGAVGGNTASSTFNSSNYSYGGGVHVAGNFSMTGGAVSGNTASSLYKVNGGGVYVAENGNFSMTGGGVNGNTASSDYETSGGGVCVVAGASFSMTGGGVNGNTATTSHSNCPVNGGGVRIEGGTFTLSGGAVSGNIASAGLFSTGGGVGVVGGGTFTLSGGAVSSNTATVGPNFPRPGAPGAICEYSGGGVYVGYSTFSMSGGAITGNTAAGVGGGVTTITSGFRGSFSMSGGTVSGNTASYGDDMCVHSGPFILSGDARPGRVGLLLDRYYDGQKERYVAITISGPLSNVTPIPIDLMISFYSTVIEDDQAFYNYGSLTDYINKPILEMDSSYSGDLASLKNYFTLGNSSQWEPNPPYPEGEPLTDYEISDGGLFVSRD
jgi:hypothetical protein